MGRKQKFLVVGAMVGIIFFTVNACQESKTEVNEHALINLVNVIPATSGDSDEIPLDSRYFPARIQEKHSLVPNSTQSDMANFGVSWTFDNPPESYSYHAAGGEQGAGVRWILKVYEGSVSALTSESAPIAVKRPGVLHTLGISLPKGKIYVVKLFAEIYGPFGGSEPVFGRKMVAEFEVNLDEK
jgi:hypothetical protein